MSRWVSAELSLVLHSRLARLLLPFSSSWSRMDVLCWQLESVFRPRRGRVQLVKELDQSLEALGLLSPQKLREPGDTGEPEARASSPSRLVPLYSPFWRNTISGLTLVFRLVCFSSVMICPPLSSATVLLLQTTAVLHSPLQSTLSVYSLQADTLFCPKRNFYIKFPSRRFLLFKTSKLTSAASVVTENIPLQCSACARLLE